MADTRMSVAELQALDGYGDVAVEQWLFDEDYVTDSVVPALCWEGCTVEPDGRCEHGNPSILLALGMI